MFSVLFEVGLLLGRSVKPINRDEGDADSDASAAP